MRLDACSVHCYACSTWLYGRIIICGRINAYYFMITKKMDSFGLTTNSNK